jgi:hypothetical protein
VSSPEAIREQKGWGLMRNVATLWRLPLFAGAKKGVARPTGTATEAPSRAAVDERQFARLVAIERKRSELSGAAYVIALIGRGEHSASEFNQFVPKITKALVGSIRDIDTIGWHASESTLGVLFTEVKGTEKLDDLAKAISARLTDKLTAALGPSRISIECSAHVPSVQVSSKRQEASAIVIALQANRGNERPKLQKAQTI